LIYCPTLQLDGHALFSECKTFLFPTPLAIFQLVSAKVPRSCRCKQVWY